MPKRHLRMSQAWWYIPVIPALGRLRQEYHEFETSLGYRVRSCLKKRKHQPLPVKIKI
jgi:hypothetical protein